LLELNKSASIGTNINNNLKTANCIIKILKNSQCIDWIRKKKKRKTDMNRLDMCAKNGLSVLKTIKKKIFLFFGLDPTSSDMICLRGQFVKHIELDIYVLLEHRNITKWLQSSEIV